MTVHRVGIAQIVESTDPEDTVGMLGLGSCVGIFFAVPGQYAIAAHCLLDHRNPAKTEAAAKYVDSALRELVACTERAGFSLATVRVGLVGGAQILSFDGGRPELEIGARNAAAATAGVSELKLRLATSDLGGRWPRHAFVQVSEGKLLVERKDSAINALAARPT